MENEFETNLKHTIQEPIYLSEEEKKFISVFQKTFLDGKYQQTETR